MCAAYIRCLSICLCGVCAFSYIKPVFWYLKKLNGLKRVNIANVRQTHVSAGSYHTAKRKQTQRKYQWNNFVWLFVVVAVCKCCVATWSHTFSKVCTTFFIFLHHISCLLDCVVFYSLLLWFTIHLNTRINIKSKSEKDSGLFDTRGENAFFWACTVQYSMQSYMYLSSHWFGIQLAYLIYYRAIFPDYYWMVDFLLCVRALHV